MKISSQQLKQRQLAPVYLISGDEFLLVQEACEIVRQLAVNSGYQEREIFHLETGFNWENFIASARNASLFGDQSLLELNLSGKISEVGSEVLLNYCHKPAKNKIVLIVAGKLDAAQQKTKWFKAIDACGFVVQIWPLDARQMLAWVTQRLAQFKLSTSAAGVKILADYAVGNLLAAAQEIEKISLIYGAGSLTTEQIITVITDNAKFNIFNLMDAALKGNKALVVHILDNLQAEDTEPAIILWSMARELRTLIQLSLGAGHNAWDKRQALLQQALVRHNTNSLQRLLQQAAIIDRIIKGADNQHVLWHEVYSIFLQLAGGKS